MTRNVALLLADPNIDPNLADWEGKITLIGLLGNRIIRVEEDRDRGGGEQASCNPTIPLCTGPGVCVCVRREERKHRHPAMRCVCCGV